MRRFGMTVPLPGVPLHAHEDWLRQLVDLGYTDLWTQETGGFDAFTPLALASVWAPSARLGTAIAQIPTRGPATLASQAAALAEAGTLREPPSRYLYRHSELFMEGQINADFTLAMTSENGRQSLPLRSR